MTKNNIWTSIFSCFLKNRLAFISEKTFGNDFVNLIGTEQQRKVQFDNFVKLNFTSDALLDIVTGTFKPTGKMPFTTPISQKAVEENQSDVPGFMKPKGYSLFKFGVGLSYWITIFYHIDTIEGFHIEKIDNRLEKLCSLCENILLCLCDKKK